MKRLLTDAFCTVVVLAAFCVPAGAQAPAASSASSPAAGQGGPTPRAQQQRWTNPQPQVPYLVKPTTQPANWIVEHDPVTPDASPEARALLKFLYTISGKQTLTGQHNYAANQGRFTAQAKRTTGKTPAIYGTDWGSAQHEIGAVRDRNVQTIIAEHQKGSIIALCWHEVRPVDSEPNTFQQSVKAKLNEAQWDELTTPGSALNQRWLAQIDVAAGYLKQLGDAHVPVLWRPLHEINGDWFWWNGRRGERGSKLLYRMMFDRLVKHHKLNNLIWVWNPDRPEREDRQFVDYFPGHQYVDVLALDTYKGYLQSYYDDLNALSDGKPLAISECGANLPPLDIYKTQPKWTYYMAWAGMGPSATPGGGRGGSGRPPTPPATAAPAGQGSNAAANPAGTTAPPATGPSIPPVDAAALVKDSRMWSLEDTGYLQAIVPIRAASGLAGQR